MYICIYLYAYLYECMRILATAHTHTHTPARPVLRQKSTVGDVFGYVRIHKCLLYPKTSLIHGTNLKTLPIHIIHIRTYLKMPLTYSHVSKDVINTYHPYLHVSKDVTNVFARIEKRHEYILSLIQRCHYYTEGIS